MLKYKGYEGSLHYCDNDAILHGKVLYIRDLICYHGETLEETKKVFEETVDEYLEDCKKSGDKPNIPNKGVH